MNEDYVMCIGKKLKDYGTDELVEELKKREGVFCDIIKYGEPIKLSCRHKLAELPITSGPVTILTVID